MRLFRNTPDQLTSLRQQQGVALFVSLMLLIVMTLIGVTGMQTTVLEERMAGHYKDRNLAFQAAEATLRDAEQFLRDQTLMPTFDGTNGFYQPVTTGVDHWDQIDWYDTSQSAQYSTTMQYVAGQPRYIVEELPAIVEEGDSLEVGTATTSRYYRITGRASGGTNTAVVSLQSVYKR